MKCSGNFSLVNAAEISKGHRRQSSLTSHIRNITLSSLAGSVISDCFNVTSLGRKTWRVGRILKGIRLQKRHSVIPLIPVNGRKSIGNLCLALGIREPHSFKIPATDVNNEAE
jgi:hypothetical protein